MKVSIVGYENDGNCEHCGRALLHCVRISDGRIVGAQCFNNIMTKPRVYAGKSYRVGASKIIELAKIAEFWSLEKKQRNGYFANSFEFELLNLENK